MNRINPENPVAPRLVLGMGVGHKAPRYELISEGNREK